jgi:enoyl-CoA hydratase/carnithine racemase
MICEEGNKVTVRITRADHMLQITIERQQAMNSIDEDTNGRLAEIWSEFESDPGLRAAVLTGAGSKAFCAGADLSTLIPSFRKKVLDGEEVTWAFGGGLARGLELTKPVIAAINGHALAGGLELALACDIRLCSPNATFSLAEVKWALIPGAGGTQRLPRTIPMTHAMEMLLTGDPIDAETAMRIGLVSRIVPQDTLLSDAMALAKKIAERGPLAVACIKRLAYHAIGADQAGMDLEHRLLLQVMRSEDAAEGTRSFLEKRAPRYVGK